MNSATVIGPPALILAASCLINPFVSDVAQSGAFVEDVSTERDVESSVNFDKQRAVVTVCTRRAAAMQQSENRANI